MILFQFSLVAGIDNAPEFSFESSLPDARVALFFFAAEARGETGSAFVTFAAAAPGATERAGVGTNALSAGAAGGRTVLVGAAAIADAGSIVASTSAISSGSVGLALFRKSYPACENNRIALDTCSGFICAAISRISARTSSATLNVTSLLTVNINTPRKYSTTSRATCRGSAPASTA